MAITWFYGISDPSSSAVDTPSIELIKEKTGVVITREGEGSYNVHNGTLQFPDMPEPANVLIHDTLGQCLIFVDVEHHFFCSINEKKMQEGYRISYNSIDWINNMIWQKEDGQFVSVAESASSSREMYRLFNIPYYGKNDSTKDKIMVFPAFYSSYHNSTRYGYITNTYIQCEKAYQPGLKLLDEKGRKFVSLGAYLLYQMG